MPSRALCTIIISFMAIGRGAGIVIIHYRMGWSGVRVAANADIGAIASRLKATWLELSDRSRPNYSLRLLSLPQTCDEE